MPRSLEAEVVLVRRSDQGDGDGEIVHEVSAADPYTGSEAT
jgi:hypothetical protein